MKRDDLKKIEGMTNEMVQAVMDLHQIDAEAWKSEKQGYIDHEKELNDKISSYDGVDVKQLQSDLAEWKEKYDNDMIQKDKDFATSRLLDGYKFTSKYAKQAVQEEFAKADLEWKDGAFVGADDFFKKLKENDPDAFVSEESGNSGQDAGGSSTGVNLNRKGSPKKETGVEAYFKQLNPDIKLD